MKGIVSCTMQAMMCMCNHAALAGPWASVCPKHRPRTQPLCASGTWGAEKPAGLLETPMQHTHQQLACRNDKRDSRLRELGHAPAADDSPRVANVSDNDLVAPHQRDRCSRARVALLALNAFCRHPRYQTWSKLCTNHAHARPQNFLSCLCRL